MAAEVCFHVPLRLLTLTLFRWTTMLTVLFHRRCKYRTGLYTVSLSLRDRAKIFFLTRKMPCGAQRYCNSVEE